MSVGDVVIFNCTASGGIPSEYSFRWFQSGVEVMSSDSVRIMDDGSSSMLMFTVEPDDFVNYTCTVNNTSTEASDSDVLLEACKWSCHNNILTNQTMPVRTLMYYVSAWLLLLPLPSSSFSSPIHHSWGT